MKPLPQRKKTAEEIAALREGFMPPAPAPNAIEKGAFPEIKNQPLVTPASTQALPSAPAAPPEPRPPVEAKPVRSLRKSERAPSTRVLTATNETSAIPVHRRSEQELNQIRRAQALSIQSPAAHLIALTAHPAIVAAGYISVTIAALLPVIDWLWARVPFAISAALAGLALAIAAFIFLKKKRSIHNAGFIAAIAVFVIIFGALYYFPQLRNAP